MDLLSSALEANGYKLSDTVQQQLFVYIQLLQKWNKVFNLTAINDLNEIIYRHILDSLSISSYLQGQRLIDVGSGAGLPGIPLALLFPERSFTLLDSNSKKTRFMTQAVCELGLKNVQVVHERCENFHPAECFDTIMTRAFATLKTMLEWTEHFLCPSGIFLAMKGLYPESEIQDIPKKFNLLAVHQLVIQGLDAKRHLVCISKGA